MSRNKPFFSFSLPSSTSTRSRPPYSRYDNDEDDGPDNTSQKRWYHYIPLCWAVFLMLIPHPSLLIVLVFYHLKILHSPIRFVLHLLGTYTLTFLAFCSLILLLARDPGPVVRKACNAAEEEVENEHEDEISLTQALLAVEDGPDLHPPGMWCHKCSAPRPERAHHCRTCGRCVLKMDHHCGWLGTCIGHRTHAAFVHFLFCVTAFSVYIACLCVPAVYYAFTHPLDIDETTPLHELFLTFYGIVFALVIGSFFIYHVYLVTTNQTTLENISPFLLLRHLPLLPPVTAAGVDGGGARRSLSNPPLEHELSYKQRLLIKDAHECIRPYDVGWRQNWNQLFGWNRPWGWVYRLLVGGGGTGDGRTFPRNPRSEAMLASLAAELVKDKYQ